MTTIFPSILPDTPFVDDAYTSAEVERMEWNDLRAVASSHPSDAVNGAMTADEMRAALVGLPRV